jgi:hypothetical protein
VRRLLTALAVGGVLAIGAATIARAAEPFGQTDRVLISTQGDVAILPGEQADGIVVINGNADVRGEVNTVVVIDGSASLVGARAESVIAINSRIEVGADTVITGKVMRLDSTVHQTGNAAIEGGVTDLAGEFIGAAAVLAPALFLLWLGFGLATIVAALLVAGLAGRQLRAAERLLADDPVQSFLIGLGAVVFLPIVAILLIVTVIGAPLGIGLLIGAMPLLAFAGYLVAATWIGGWIVRETASRPEEEIERPFLPVLAGVLVLSLIGLVPVLTIISAVASLLGFGAVIRFAFRTLRGAPRPVAGAPLPLSAPTGA